MTPTVIRADARCLPLADNSVDLIVTSPPYFALRSYQDGGEHYAEQIGSEATPHEFLDALWTCTREWMRVLKPSGSIWVNLGDKYASYEGNRGDGRIQSNDPRPRSAGGAGLTGCGAVRAKSLFGIPWRYAIGCVDQLGLILRAEVIWSKPNGLPESVTDRVRRSHEQWFHFTMQPRYFSAVDEIRESYDAGTAARYRTGYKQDPRDMARIGKGYDWSDAGPGQMAMNPLGKLPGSVWIVATEPLIAPEHLGVDHFAAFPTEWPRRLIRGWSPAGVCVKCGEGRRPVTERGPEYDEWRRSVGDYNAANRGPSGDYSTERGKQRVESLRVPTDIRLTGYACACLEPTAKTRPAVVLDPFGGTGTTALVASVLGRVGVSVDLSGDYCRLARWRTTDPGERARAMRVPKPPKQADGQLDLLGEAS